MNPWDTPVAAYVALVASLVILGVLGALFGG
jgi:hypothetical protein